jgi:aminoglycoside 3-N-acetyltransferase
MVSDTIKALREIGIKEGDTIFLHSDAIVVSQYSGFGNNKGIISFINYIIDYIGKKGTLIMPTFTYSFSENEIYDIKNSPSKVGLITEVFRGMPGVIRSPDPMFSIASYGRDKKNYVHFDPYYCFGDDTFFSLIHKNNCWVIGIGCTLERGGTFLHYVEKKLKVEYRYEKPFSGVRILNNNNSQKHEISYFVRDLSRETDLDLTLLKNTMLNEKKLIKSKIGRILCWSMRANDCFNYASKLFESNKVALIKEGIQNGKK